MKIKLNPDNSLVVDIREKIKNNDGYCPCNLVKTPDTLCMCKDFRNMVNSNKAGECHCGLYISEYEKGEDLL